MFPYSLNKLIRELAQGMGDTRTYRTIVELIDDAVIPADAAMVRFDVERNCAHHVRIAKKLADAGTPASFYFHTRVGSYDRDGIHRIRDLGHEVGFHHECLDRCRGDFAKARDLFLREVEFFRKDGIDIQTCCNHGELFLSKPGYQQNADLFTRYPELLAEAGLRGEVQHWIRGQGLHYPSDTLTTYRRFWPMLYAARADTSKPVMVLTHPHRWHVNPVKTTFEITRDLAWAFSNRAKGQRSYRLVY